MTNNWTYLETNRWLDPVIEDLYKELRNLFPEMTEWVLKSNGIFTKLLNDYINWELDWITEFLDNRGYEFKDSILLSSEKIEMRPKAREKVLNWEYFVWLKLFFEIEEWIMKEKKYLIFAKKKDKPWFEWLSEWVKNFLAWFMSPKWQN